MNIITIVTLCFLILEATNVLTLYFFPGSKYANGVGVFKAWEKSKTAKIMPQHSTSAAPRFQASGTSRAP